MIKEKQQPKFCVNQEVRFSEGNSLTPVYEVLKVFWWDSENLFAEHSCYKYVLYGKDYSDVIVRKEFEIKSADELCPCPYEVYGNKMVGKTVKSVEFSSENLIITFEDGCIAKFSADCCQNYGYLDFGGNF